MSLALQVTGLQKIYHPHVVAVKGINLEVEEGDFFALLGPNGAGKSTTIGIISSLVKKTAGKVLVFGQDMDISPGEVKRCISIVPQEINLNLFERVLQIVMNQAGYYGIPRRIAMVRAEYYLQKMGLWDKRNSVAFRLSGGMKRRLLIVRALISEPRLLILDEPTAGVDIELRHATWQLLGELNQGGMTIILTTHYLEEAESLCKHVAIIDRGEIIENTDMRSLINRMNVQTLILDLQNALPSLYHLDNYKHRVLDDMTLEVELNKGQSLNELFHELNRSGFTITSMRNKTNRLEELFVRLIAENNKDTL